MLDVWTSSALALVPIIGFFTMKFFSRTNHFPVKGRTVLITGGSQGLGLSLANSLSRRGANVIIVAQTVAKLESALKTISANALHPAEQRFHYISADLRSSTSTASVLSEVTSWNNGAAPDIVWCCAGHCIPGFFADVSLDTLRGQMDTLYWSAANMAHVALNLWLQPDKATSTEISQAPARHLVFTSSGAAFCPVAGYGPYTPAKAAMRALSDTLRQEVEMYSATKKITPIQVHTVFPMGILTPGFENENKIKPALTQKIEKDDKPQKPEDVAEISIRRLEAGDYLVSTMLEGHILKGAGYGVSVKNSVIVDAFWSFAGWCTFNLFLTGDQIRKCRNWGQEKGLVREAHT